MTDDVYRMGCRRGVTVGLLSLAQEHTFVAVDMGANGAWTASFFQAPIVGDAQVMSSVIADLSRLHGAGPSDGALRKALPAFARLLAAVSEPLPPASPALTERRRRRTWRDPSRRCLRMSQCQKSCGGCRPKSRCRSCRTGGKAAPLLLPRPPSDAGPFSVAVQRHRRDFRICTSPSPPATAGRGASRSSGLFSFSCSPRRPATVACSPRRAHSAGRTAKRWHATAGSARARQVLWSSRWRRTRLSFRLLSLPPSSVPCATPASPVAATAQHWPMSVSAACLPPTGARRQLPDPHLSRRLFSPCPASPTHHPTS